MEPWDGPAAIAATDNEWVIAATDKMAFDHLDTPLPKTTFYSQVRNWNDKY